MQVIQFGEQLNCPLVLCLGFFGSMHKGHVELLNRAKNRARITNSKVALFTFSNNHLAVLGRDNTVVYTFDERLRLYDDLGVDYVIVAEFNDDFRKLSSREFLFGLNRYNLDGGVFCGFDYCCGCDHLDALSIRKNLHKINDIPVYIVEQISIENKKISTSLLRDYLISNQIVKANALLSEPFFVCGSVVHGRGVGKTLGFPTANMVVPEEKLLPSGVFSAKTVINGEMYHAIVNIGNTPTFDITRKVFEVHLIDFDGDLYGKDIKVSIVNYLRPITKFNSPSELARQLQRDKENAQND